MLGIDMSPGNGTSSADISTCTQVQPGDNFDADIFVSNAQNLVAWELRVDYNPDVVSLESADYGYFLTQSGGGIAAQLFDQESPGRKFLAAAEPRFGDSGSGVLARLHLVARGQGNSSLGITASPSFLGPKLQSAGGVPFADFDGDNIFDGGLSGATVAVGRSCGASTPVVTPSPAPTSHPTPTAKPGGTTPTPGPGVKTPTPTARVPGATGAPGTTATQAPADSGSGSDGGGSGTDGTGSGEQPTPKTSEFVKDAPGGNSSGGDGGNSNGSSSSEGTSSDNSSAGDQAQASGGGSDSTTLILVIAGAFAALCVVLGGTFLIMRGSPKR